MKASTPLQVVSAAVASTGKDLEDANTVVANLTNTTHAPARVIVGISPFLDAETRNLGFRPRCGPPDG